MSELRKRFSNINLTLNGKKIKHLDGEELEFLNDIPSHQEVYLVEKRPLHFINYFLSLLDNGHTPIVLPSDVNLYQIETLKQNNSCASWLINGKLEISRQPQRNSYTGCYACLSSGSTGIPKKCYLNVIKAQKNAQAHSRSMLIDSRNNIIQTLPLYHSFGIMAYIWTPLSINCSIDLNQMFLGVKSLSKRILSNSVLHISPAQLRFIIKEKQTIENGVEIVSVGGGLCSNEEMLKLQEKFPKSILYRTYGLTEAGPRVSTLRWERESKENSVGYLIEGVSASIKDKSDYKPYGNGRLVIASPYLMENLKEIQLETEDLVDILHDGEIIFNCRQDDLINLGGVSIYAQDIETVINQHPEVKDSIVLKMFDKIYGEVPVLFIESNIEAHEIESYIKGKLTLNQTPKKIIILDKLPRLSIDKIDRKKLMELL